MNPPDQSTENPEAIRSEIDHTRERLDQTIDALGQRLKGRHLIDEALHLFRTQQENGNMTKFTNKLSTSATSTLHTVTDTVKNNPIPLALIGAGVAWYLYSRNRGPASDYGSGDYEGADDYQDYYSGGGYAATAGRSGDGGEAGDSFDPSNERGADDLAGKVRSKVEGVGEGIREGASQLRERAGETFRSVSDKTSELGSMAKERSQQMYQQGRERVASTLREHPLETGLVCLALGFVAGMALPTSERVRSVVAPKARELRDRAGDMMERGRRVVQSGAEALKHEAEAQGLTPKGLAEKAGAVANKAGDAARETAQNEGFSADRPAESAGASRSGADVGNA